MRSRMAARSQCPSAISCGFKLADLRQHGNYQCRRHEHCSPSHRFTTAELGTLNANAGANLNLDIDNTGAVFAIPNGVNLDKAIKGGTIEGTLII